MAKDVIALNGFLGENRSLQPHQLNPTPDGDVRMDELQGIDPSELRELTPRPAWLLLERPVVANLVWPRRVDNTGAYVT